MTIAVNPVGTFKGMYYIYHKSLEVDLKSKTEMWAIDDLQTKTAGVPGARLSGLKLLWRKVIP